MTPTPFLRIMVIGSTGVAAFAMADGSRDFVQETEQIADYAVHGEGLILHVTAAVAGIPPENGAGGVVALDLHSDNLGPMIGWPELGPLVTGPLGGPHAFVTEDGRHAYIVDADGYLRRYSL